MGGPGSPLSISAGLGSLSFTAGARRSSEGQAGPKFREIGAAGRQARGSDYNRVGSVAQDRIPLWQSELYVPEAHALEPPLMPGGSLYTKIGDVFAWTCLILTGLGLILARRRR